MVNFSPFPLNRIYLLWEFLNGLVDGVFECEDEGHDHEENIDEPGTTENHREKVQTKTGQNSPDISWLRRKGRDEEDRHVHAQEVKSREK